MIAFRRLAILGMVALAVACTVSDPTSTPGDPRAAGEVEPSAPGEPVTSEGRDAGTKPTTPDASTSKPPPPPPPTPDDILGTLSGACPIVNAELTTATPSFGQNGLAFVAGETYEKASLSLDGQRMFDSPNAGGSSIESEVMSLEVLRSCAGAKLLKTETEIGYVNDDAGPATITDMLVEIDAKKVGVSVTRAYKPSSLSFPDSEVKNIVQKKLEGILRSSQRVKPEDKWVKQILHVFAATQAQADAVVRVLPTIDAAVRADTIVLLTQTTGGGFVYCNPDPPLGSECP